MIALLPLALARGWPEAATSAHALPESFPLFRGVQMYPCFAFEFHLLLMVSASCFGEFVVNALQSLA